MKNILIIFLTIILVSTAFFSGCINLDSSTDTSEYIDTDGDGIDDISDDFPKDPSEWKDIDGDGVGDNADAFPSDPFEWRDSDSDKTGDNSDDFPDDPSEWRDLDGDGIGDNSDKNPYVNLSVEISIEKFIVTSRVDLFRWAQVYFEIYVNDDLKKIFDNDKDNWKVIINNEQKVGKTFYYDIPDRTTEDFTYFTIIMKDYDFLKFDSDDIIDINEKADEKKLILKFDNEKNSLEYSGISRGNQGTIWYSIKIPEQIDPTSEILTRSYYWRFDNNNWRLNLEIPINTYENYKNLDVDRMPQGISNNAMKSFVTTDEIIIEKLSKDLKNIAEDKSYSSIETTNFILRFVQETITYREDYETKGLEEYWRFPVETLVDKKGDCEDSAVLFSSIMKALGYDPVLLFYILDGETGHLAAGIHLNDGTGNYITHNSKKYYYCETTTTGNSVGQIPLDIIGMPEKVIEI